MNDEPHPEHRHHHHKGAGALSPWTANLQGPGGQLFADPAPSPDETSFQVDNTDEAYYNSPYYTQHENDSWRSRPAARRAAGARVDRRRRSSWRRSSRPTGSPSTPSGDTGASIAVCDLHRGDCRRRDGRRVAEQIARPRPAFLFHLGDVIYNFGEGRVLLRPVLRAVPRLRSADLRGPREPRRRGLLTNAMAPARTPTLQAFIANFCAAAPGARRCRRPGAHDMTQPGRLLHPRRALGLDHRPVRQCARGPRVITSQGGTTPRPATGR